MKQLPRSLELRAEDNERTMRIRIMEWTRDVLKSLRSIPDVEYITVDVPASPDLDVATSIGRPRSVVIARVNSGTTTAAPGIEWDPQRDGFTITALWGFSGAARLTLRVEV